MNRLHLSATIFSFVVLYSTFTFPVIGATLTPGSVDSTFNPGVGVAGGPVVAVTTDSLGRVIIAGWFTSVGGVARNGIARLNGDGTLDPTFDPGTGATNYFSATVYSVTTDSLDRVIIGGDFTFLDNVVRTGVARLNSDGSVDTTFDVSVVHQPFSDYTVYSVTADSNDRVIISGLFSFVNGVARTSIARLNTNGTLDLTFASIEFDRGYPSSVALDSAERVIIGGPFGAVNGVTRNGIARLNSNGGLDTTFNPGSGIGEYDAVYSVTTDWNDRVVIGGWITSVNGLARSGVAKLNVNGSVYSEFDPGSGTNDYVSSVAVDTSGRVIIAGEFTSVDEIPRNGIARLKRNGEVDETFNPGTGASNSARAVAVDIGGRVIVGGGFTSMNGVERNRIARLHGGEIDATPGINITFDYRYDTNGFFAGSNIHRRIILEEAARVFEGRLLDRLAAIVPNDVTQGVIDSWEARFNDPVSGASAEIRDLYIPANTVIIFVGGGTVGFDAEDKATATSSYAIEDNDFTHDQVISRGGGTSTGGGANDYSGWGGSIRFSASQAIVWHDSTLALVPSGKTDLYSVAVHEIGHILGISAVAPSWNNLRSAYDNNREIYYGLRGRALYGDSGPLFITKGSPSHFVIGTMGTVESTNSPQEMLMTPEIALGIRKYFTNLDFAALDDLGWEVLWPTKPDTSAARQAIQNLITATIRRIDAAKKANNKRVLKAQKRKLKALKIQMATL